MGTENEITLQEIIAILWHKAWLIILVVILGAGMGFSVSKWMIEPEYSSKMSMYVNNNKDRNETALNINDLNASQKLVTTYIEILKSEVVLNKVIKEMSLNYSAAKLRGMISASSVNGTEILEVKITGKDPEEAAAIANKLSEVAPPEIIRVVKAGDVQLIDKAVVNRVPVSPNVMLNTVIAAMLGAAFSVLGVLVAAMLDIRVKSSEELGKQHDLPVLGTIPDILNAIGNGK